MKNKLGWLLISLELIVGFLVIISLFFLKMIQKDLSWRFGNEKMGEITIDKKEIEDYMKISALALVSRIEVSDNKIEIEKLALGPLYSGKALFNQMSYEQLCEIRKELQRAISRKIEEFRK